MIHVCTMCGIRNICTRDEPSLDCLRAAMEAEEQRKKPKTNADCIRAMSDEELANIIWRCPEEDVESRIARCNRYYSCSNCQLDWLKEEVKE